MPSTAIRNIIYDTATCELWVTFVTGRRYVYQNVTPDVASAFQQAQSRGAFFNSEIRDRYSYREVTPPYRRWAS
ncbi:MAG: KTSC domain-containing protein [Bradyrhizobiaceae bacterium]|nr:MAG: KTSC domain-containing protein [Bradyrhizobiaceae bacterium]